MKRNLQERWRRLSALADDPAASSAEKELARKLLADLEAGGFRAEQPTRVVVAGLESWELALLLRCAEGVRVQSLEVDGTVHVIGAADEVNRLEARYDLLRSQLEEVVIAAVGGWLSARFSPGKRGASRSALGGPELDVARAARAASRAAPDPAVRLLPLGRKGLL